MSINLLTNHLLDDAALIEIGDSSTGSYDLDSGKNVTRGPLHLNWARPANRRISYVDATGGLKCDTIVLTADDLKENILTYSEDFTNGSWGKSNCTITGNTITGPFRRAADTLTDAATTGRHYLYKTCTVTSGETYKIRLWAKAGTKDWLRLKIGDKYPANAYAFFDLASGEVGTIGAGAPAAEIYPAGNGWYICEIVDTATSSGTNYIELDISDADASSSYIGDTTGTIYLGACGYARATHSTSYVANTSGTTTGLDFDLAQATTYTGDYSELSSISGTYSYSSEELTDLIFTPDSAITNAQCVSLDTTSDSATGVIGKFIGGNKLSFADYPSGRMSIEPLDEIIVLQRKPYRCTERLTFSVGSLDKDAIDTFEALPNLQTEPLYLWDDSGNWLPNGGGWYILQNYSYELSDPYGSDWLHTLQLEFFRVEYHA